MLRPLFFTTAAALCCSTSAVAAEDVRDIQLRRLLEPTQSELAQESEGRIYIYEALTNQDIRRAMHEEFDRVESMMFIRVPKTDDSGKVMKDKDTGEMLIEDDGC